MRKKVYGNKQNKNLFEGGVYLNRPNAHKGSESAYDFILDSDVVNVVQCGLNAGTNDPFYYSQSRFGIREGR